MFTEWPEEEEALAKLDYEWPLEEDCEKAPVYECC